MAVKKRKESFYLYFCPFKGLKQVGIKVDVRTKTEAERLEATILRACRTEHYESLDPVAREACARIFRNQGWELSPGLGGGESRPTEELTLWKAAQLFLKYPEIRASAEHPRYKQCLVNLAAYFGKDRSIKSIWIPDIKSYIVHRIAEKAAPSTVNREKGTLSKVFQTLIELQFIEANPCRLVKSLSQKAGERQVYLSRGTVQDIADNCPEWYQPILWTAFYTGMRRKEILELERKRVNLSKRLLYLRPKDDKERDWKRVPIHRELVPILEAVLNRPALISGKVFALVDGEGVRELGIETFKNVWERACHRLQLEKPQPHFHDLRHTWRTNARRSGVDPDIAESILGHWNRARPVNQRYGRISDEELLAAVDKMTFDHGQTEILTASG